MLTWTAGSSAVGAWVVWVTVAVARSIQVRLTVALPRRSRLTDSEARMPSSPATPRPVRRRRWTETVLGVSSPAAG